MDSVLIDGAWDWVKPLMQKLANIEVFQKQTAMWVAPESLALFIAICKAWPDSEDDFPKGKWAGIQYLEARLGVEIQRKLNFGDYRCTEGEMTTEDDMLSKAIGSLSKALGSIVEDTGETLIDIHEACCELEAIGTLTGIESVSTTRLRKALEKRGLHKPESTGGNSHD